MSLLSDLSDLAHEMLTDTDGFASAATIVSPGGQSYGIKLLGADIALTFDQETQQQVAGRKVTCAVSSRQLEELGISPKEEQDNSRHPWVVIWTPSAGPALRLKVVAVLPDKIGVTVLELETYRRETR